MFHKYAIFLGKIAMGSFANIVPNLCGSFLPPLIPPYANNASKRKRVRAVAQTLFRYITIFEILACSQLWRNLSLADRIER